VSASATEDSRPAGAVPEVPEALAAMDLFALGRLATAARDAQWSGRGFFARARAAEGDGIVRFPFQNGESDAERLERLAAIAQAAP